MIETLRIFGKKEKEAETIKFDEIMCCDGSWVVSLTDLEVERTVRLDYKSIKWEYYLYESLDGMHVLYRKRK